MDSCEKSLAGLQTAIDKIFYKIGHFVGSYPLPFVVVPVLVFFALGTGFLKFKSITDAEAVYTPQGARAFGERDTVFRVFPDRSGVNFDGFSSIKNPYVGQIIFHSRNSQAIFTNEVLAELEVVYNRVLDMSASGVRYSDVCVRKGGTCAIYGSQPFEKTFRALLAANRIKYPVGLFGDLTGRFGKVRVESPGGILKAAGSFKMSFPMRIDTDRLKSLSRFWLDEYQKLMESLQLKTVDFRYSLGSVSVGEELKKSTGGDIKLFLVTFVMMIVYSCIVSSGGDCISTRAMLAIAGVLSATMGTVSAFGLTCLAGREYTATVGLMPFLLLGVGLDDMFLLMSCYSDTNALTGISLPQRMGTVFMKGGVGITITSLTNFLSFMVGVSSDLLSVQTFCIYTGLGVLFCYLYVITFFGGCMTYHGRRVSQRRHTVTCKPITQSREEMKASGQHGSVYISCFSGDIARRAEDDQSACERGPRGVENIILSKPMRVFILLLFSAYIGLSVWGCTLLETGLEIKDLVAKSSYYYKFNEWDTEDFLSKDIISFVKAEPATYNCEESLDNWQDVLSTAMEDRHVSTIINRCWLTAFCESDIFKNQTSKHGNLDEEPLASTLQTFLSKNIKFTNDVVFGGANNRTIEASKCYIKSEDLTQFESAELMLRMREVADSSPLGVFVYNPSFVFYEQFVTVKQSIFSTISITVAVMFVVACVFLPHPTIVVLVIVMVLMIITGVLGFMGFWHLSLSPVTMICLIMASGFSVDFCAHVCSAYLAAKSRGRGNRAREALLHIVGPVLNGGLTSLLGVSVLNLSESSIFQSFFKIMFLVVVFGSLHALLLIPVILSYIGPHGHHHLPEIQPSAEHLLLPQPSEHQPQPDDDERNDQPQPSDEQIHQQQLSDPPKHKQKPSRSALSVKQSEQEVVQSNNDDDRSRESKASNTSLASSQNSDDEE